MNELKVGQVRRCVITKKYYIIDKIINGFNKYYEIRFMNTIYGGGRYQEHMLLTDKIVLKSKFTKLLLGV